MTVTITAFDWVPDFAKGQVRDLRVRWALEEVGERYDVRYLSQGEQKAPPHRARQPFGQLPTLEEDGLTLFESGAIIHHIASTRAGLFPADPAARARAIEWMFAALNTVEPPIMDLATIDFFEADKPWSKPRRPAAVERITTRFREVADRLGDAEWLDGDFTAGDLLMVSVLRILDGEAPLTDFPTLVAYVARGTARPAFQRALAAQLAGFAGNPPKGWQEPKVDRPQQPQGEQE